MAKFDFGRPVWSVAWSPGCSHQLYAGLGNGSIGLADLRMPGARPGELRVSAPAAPPPIHTLVPLPGNAGGSVMPPGGSDATEGAGTGGGIVGGEGGNVGVGGLGTERVLAASMRGAYAWSPAVLGVNTIALCPSGQTVESIALDIGDDFAAGAAASVGGFAVDGSGPPAGGAAGAGLVVSVRSSAADPQRQPAFHELYTLSEAAPPGELPWFVHRRRWGGHASCAVLTRGAFVRPPGSDASPLFVSSDEARRSLCCWSPASSRLSAVQLATEPFPTAVVQVAPAPAPASDGWGGHSTVLAAACANCVRLYSVEGMHT